MNTSSQTALPWRIPLVFAVTFFVHYLDRNLISLALPAMASDFKWTDKQLASYGELLLGAFFLSYGVSQMLLAGAAQRWGPKRSLVAVVGGFSLITMAMGYSALLGGIAAMVALRFLLGIAESVHVPMMSAVTARHFPTQVRARANSTWAVGLIVATACGPLIAVPVITNYGWERAFALIGLVGLIVALPLLLWGVPTDDAVARSSAPQSMQVQQPPRAKRSANYWLYVLCGVLNAFCGFGILGWLPTYFVRAKNIDFAALGWPLALVFTAGVVATLLIAWWGDRVGRRVWLAACGYAGAAVLVLLAIQAQSLVPLVALFALATACQSAFTAQEYATVQQLAGDTDVGAATGLYNGISLVIGGVGGSLVPGAIVAATGSFDAGLTSVAVGAVLACVACTWLAVRMGRAAPSGTQHG